MSPPLPTNGLTRRALLECHHNFGIPFCSLRTHNNQLTWLPLQMHPIVLRLTTWPTGSASIEARGSTKLRKSVHPALHRQHFCSTARPEVNSHLPSASPARHLWRESVAHSLHYRPDLVVSRLDLRKGNCATRWHPNQLLESPEVARSRLYNQWNDCIRPIPVMRWMDMSLMESRSLSGVED